MSEPCRPRCCFGSCPSLFQTTRSFYHIDADDAAVESDESYAQAPEDDFPPSVRAAKRRRIERLANDFLSGKELHISSVTLVPDDVRCAVAGAFERPKDAWKTLAECAPQERPTRLWEDVPNDREILQAFLSSTQHLQQSEWSSSVAHSSQPPEQSKMTQIHAQASCGPRRRLRSAAKVTFRPSDEAICQTAELRNRRRRASVGEAINESQPQPCPRPRVSESQPLLSVSETQETASDCGPSPTPAWTSSKWIKSGVLELRRRAVNEDCSRDELGASSVFTPSQRSRTRSRPLGRTHAATRSFDSGPSASGATSSASIVMCTTNHEECAGHRAGVRRPLDVDPGRLTDCEGQAAAASRNDIAPNLDEHSESPDGDSQTRLRRRQGVRANLRTSWTTINEVTEPSEECNNCTRNISVTSAAQHFAAPNTSREVSHARQVRSAGNSPSQTIRRASPRPLSALPESQGSKKRIENQTQRFSSSVTHYTAVTAKNGGSPFMFRKRTSTSNKSDGLNIEPHPVPVTQQLPAKTPQRVVLPTSNTPQVARKSAKSSTADTERASRDSNTPLVDQHLNSILPRNATSGQCVSSLRRSLRDELVASGAEMSRCSDDLSSSLENMTDGHIQLVETSNVNDVADNPPEVVRNVQSQKLLAWPDTQVMLMQAHQDLFTPPDKADTTLYVGEQRTPFAQNVIRTSRRPLQQLSQEQLPMPSTQALLDGWHGWSSIKKPRSGNKLSVVSQSPAVATRATTNILMSLDRSVETVDKRRSSLRFSTSITDSPDRPHGTDMASKQSPSTTQQSVRPSSRTFVKATVNHQEGRAAEGPATVASSTQPEETQHISFLETDGSLSFGNALPRYQNAQSHAALDLDSQDLEQTMTELVDDVLGTATHGMESTGF